MSPVDLRAARRPALLGQDALVRLAVRLSWLYTVSAGVALVWCAVDDGSTGALPSTVAVVAALAGNACVVASVCRHRTKVAIVAVTLSNALAPAAVALLFANQGWNGGQLAAATAATAGGMGTALALGPVLGLHTAFVALVFIGGGTLLGGDSINPPWLIGCAVGTAVASAIGVLARRAFLVSDAAIIGTDEAVIATEVSAARWAARRAVDRDMHDTVLTTFSLLAHGDPQTDADELRVLCRRDVTVLAGNGRTTPSDGIGTEPAAPELPLSSPSPLDDLAAVWGNLGLNVRTSGTPWPEGVAGLEAEAVASLLAALRECLSNVARHAGTTFADVTLSRTGEVLTAMVVDAGCGFDPAAVPVDRLGLAESVRGRVADLGGEVTVFSRPGQGTTVVLNVPVPDRLARTRGPR